MTVREGRVDSEGGKGGGLPDANPLLVHTVVGVESTVGYPGARQQVPAVRAYQRERESALPRDGCLH